MSGTNRGKAGGISAIAAVFASLVAALALSVAMAPAAYADGSDLGAAPSLPAPQELPAAQPGGSAANATNATNATGADPARRVLEPGLYNIGSVAHEGVSLSIDNRSKRSGAQAASAGTSVSDWAQKWVVTWDSATGYYRMRNLNSRKYLGVSGGAAKGAVVKQYKSAKVESRLWEPVEAEDGIVFKSAGSNYALALTSKGKFTLRKAKSAEDAPESQQFELRKVDPLETDQTYFVNNVATGNRLHVAHASRSNRAKLDLAAPEADKSQKFRLLKAGSSYRLQNVRSCFYPGTNGEGTGVVRQLKAKTSRTRWKIEFDLEAAAFTISSAKSGLRLGGAERKLALGEPLGDDSQLFTFARTYAFKLYLDPGHGKNNTGNGSWDPGAGGNGYDEADLTADLARRVEERLSGTDVKVVNGGKFGLPYYKRTRKAIKLGCDANVSLHFNADGGSGTMKMVGGDRRRAPGSDKLANCVHAGVVANLGLPDLGRSVRSDIRVVNAGLPSMLEEVCFIDNAHDVSTYLKRRDAVAQGIADGIVKASRSRAVLR